MKTITKTFNYMDHPEQYSVGIDWMYDHGIEFSEYQAPFELSITCYVAPDATTFENPDFYESIKSIEYFHLDH